MLASQAAVTQAAVTQAPVTQVPAPAAPPARSDATSGTTYGIEYLYDNDGVAFMGLAMKAPPAAYASRRPLDMSVAMAVSALLKDLCLNR